MYVINGYLMCLKYIVNISMCIMIVNVSAVEPIMYDTNGYLGCLKYIGDSLHIMVVNASGENLCGYLMRLKYIGDNMCIMIVNVSAVEPIMYDINGYLGCLKYIGDSLHIMVVNASGETYEGCIILGGFFSL